MTTRFNEAAALRIHRVGFGPGKENSTDLLLIQRRQERTPTPDAWGVKSIVSPARVRAFWIHWATDFEEPPPGLGPYKDEFYVPMNLIRIGHYRHQMGTEDLPSGPFVVDEDDSNVARWAPRVGEMVRKAYQEMELTIPPAFDM